MKTLQKPNAQFLASERARLRHQIDDERAELAEAAARLRGPLRMIADVQHAAGYVRTHVGLLIVPAVVLLLWRPRATLRIAAGLLGIWRGYRLAAGEGPLEERMSAAIGAVLDQPGA